MMLTTPILVLALLGQAPPTTAPADDHSRPAAEQAQPADDSAGDPNGAPDPAQPVAQNPVPAQKPPSKHDLKEPPTPEHTGIRALFGNLLEDFKHLPTATNGIIAAGGGVAALAVHPEDQKVNTYMVDHYTQFNAFFAPGKYIGDTPEQIAGAIVTYAYGRWRDQPKVSHFGMDLLQAQIIGRDPVQPDQARDTAPAAGWQRPPVVPVRSRDDHVRDRDGDRAASGLAESAAGVRHRHVCRRRRAFTTTSTG